MKVNRKFRNILCGFLTLVFILLIIACLSYYFKWNKFYCVHRYIDINSGDTRFQRYVFFITTSDEIRVTPFSEFVHKNFEIHLAPNWKLVESSSFISRTSPQHIYHSAIAACDGHMRLYDICDITQKKKKELIRQCLDFLRKGEIKSIETLTKNTFYDFRN